MKRILNLNDFSGPALKTILLIGLGLPAALFFVDWLLDRVGMRLPALDWLARIFLGIGAVLLLLFFVLVVVEQIQDRLIYQRYLRERGRQVNGECPFCGNRHLRPFEHACPVCGETVSNKN